MLLTVGIMLRVLDWLLYLPTCLVWLVMMCPRDQERVREYKYLSVVIAFNVYPLSVLVIQIKALVVTDNFLFNKAGVDICSVPAGYLVPQPPTAPQERNFTLFLRAM
jgi:hypothetical protein